MNESWLISQHNESEKLNGKCGIMLLPYGLKGSPERWSGVYLGGVRGAEMQTPPSPAPHRVREPHRPGRGRGGLGARQCRIMHGGLWLRGAYM